MKLFITRCLKSIGTPSHIFEMVVCHGNIPWLFAVEICRCYLWWVFAVGICRSYLPWVFAVAICRGFVLCMQTNLISVWANFFFFVSKIFLDESKTSLMRAKLFLFTRISFLTVFLFLLLPWHLWATVLSASIHVLYQSGCKPQSRCKPQCNVIIF